MVKVMVIGARRRRQGIGEFIARAFFEEGCEICAVIGTRRETAEEARVKLATEYGLECRAYFDLEAALDIESPDIAVIASPYLTHRPLLERIARADIHCLCEKPMWWREDPAVEIGEETASLVDAFLSRNRIVALVTQWPFTLPAFYRLYPHQRERTVERFQMLLGPSTTGLDTVLNSAPHVISLLQALVGRGRLENPTARYEGPESRVLELDFEYHSTLADVAVSCRFETCESSPRPAGYSINGDRVDRVIELPEYSQRFVGSGRSVDIEDPLQCLVRDFLEKVNTHAPVDREALIESVTLLEPLRAAVQVLRE